MPRLSIIQTGRRRYEPTAPPTSGARPLLGLFSLVSVREERRMGRLDFSILPLTPLSSLELALNSSAGHRLSPRRRLNEKVPGRLISQWSRPRPDSEKARRKRDRLPLPLPSPSRPRPKNMRGPGGGRGGPVTSAVPRERAAMANVLVVVVVNMATHVDITARSRKGVVYPPRPGQLTMHHLRLHRRRQRRHPPSQLSSASSTTTLPTADTTTGRAQTLRNSC